MTSQERRQLTALGEEIRDDLARAERMGKGSIGLHAVKYYAARIEELLELEPLEQEVSDAR